MWHGFKKVEKGIGFKLDIVNYVLFLIYIPNTNIEKKRIKGVKK